MNAANLVPANAIAAATHADPYPYYAQLVEQTPLYRDDSLSLWVASSADAVTATLTNPSCRVRPIDEPIPRALLGSPAAEIFRHLIRMNDGAGHCPFNKSVATTLGSIAATQVATHSKHWASRLFDQFCRADDLAGLNDFAFRLSAHVIGSLLGAPDERLVEISDWTGDFVRCVFPSSTTEQIERGKIAAGKLLDVFASILAANRRNTTDTLLLRLAREAERVGRADPAVILANGVGFLSQAYEATAGLIGNTLLTLATHQDLCEQISNDLQLLRELLLEVLRFDPPAHTTRRFLANDATLLDQSMRAGDAVLVVVAAANRDPKANADPHRFELHRKERRLFSFGAGMHACPGDAIALAIAEAGVAAVIASGLDLASLRGRFSYRASANTRIPLFRS